MTFDKPRLLVGQDAMNSALWHECCRLDPACRFTQTPFWAQLGAEELNWQVNCLAWPANGALFPFVITHHRASFAIRAESMPWGHIGGLMMCHEQNVDIASLSIPIGKVAAEVIVNSEEGASPLQGWEKQIHRYHSVKLAPTPDEQWGMAGAKCRTAARHAQREGVHVVMADSGSCLETTIMLHHNQQRSRRAREFPRRWWERVLRDSDNHSGLWCAVHDGKTIASLLVVWWNTYATALVSTSDPQARPLKAGNLLYLTVLEELGVRGLQVLDLGGSRGIRSLEWFKESVGAELEIRTVNRHRSRTYRIYQGVTGRLTGMHRD